MTTFTSYQITSYRRSTDIWDPSWAAETTDLHTDQDVSTYISHCQQIGETYMAGFGDIPVRTTRKDNGYTVEIGPTDFHNVPAWCIDVRTTTGQ